MNTYIVILLWISTIILTRQVFEIVISTIIPFTDSTFNLFISYLAQQTQIPKYFQGANPQLSRKQFQRSFFYWQVAKGWTHWFLKCREDLRGFMKKEGMFFKSRTSGNPARGRSASHLPSMIGLYFKAVLKFCNKYDPDSTR